MVEPHTGRGLYQLDDDSGLYKAMGGAGSSYGIVTEFLYRIYPRPETLPIIAMVYLENRYDIRKMEKAAQDGRYHVSWFIGYAFRDLNVFHGNTIVSSIFFLVVVLLMYQTIFIAKSFLDDLVTLRHQ